MIQYYYTFTHATWESAYAEALRMARLSGRRWYVAKPGEPDRFTRPWVCGQRLTQ